MKGAIPEMSDKNLPGLSLRSTLRGHAQNITRIAWSPDGQIIASPSEDHTIRLWDAKTDQCLHIFSGHTDIINTIAWSPDGRILASASDDATIKLWSTQAGQDLKTLRGHKAAVTSVAFVPDGQMLVSGSSDGTIKLWGTEIGQCQDSWTGLEVTVKNVSYAPDGQMLTSYLDNGTIQFWDIQHKSLFDPVGSMLVDASVTTLVWSPDGLFLATSSSDGTIKLWKVRDEEQQLANEESLLVPEVLLEGHTDIVTSLSFSRDGRLLASKSRDGTVRLWRTDSWQMVTRLGESASGRATPGIAFHPTESVLATLGEEDTVIRVWDLDVSVLLATTNASPSCLYRNAKVVLVGDSGVGKSGLGLVLTGQPFVPTESTHGRHVWTFENQRVKLDDGNEEIRETLLWDLAGQPGYRLIHQLHLGEVTLALVTIDARSETNPFAGVYHWDHALRVAQRSQSHPEEKPKKFLVSARIDRGGIKASRERIDVLKQELHFDGFFETSAKEGRGVALLSDAIRKAVDWDALPKISSTDLFMEIKAFLVAERKTDRILSSIEDLYQGFLKGRGKQNENVREEFETCIEQMEMQGFLRKLSIGDLILLRPELIDAYASALVNAVRDEPDGLGSIEEVRVRTVDFSMPDDERLYNREQERLLLISMIEDLLRDELALRERTEEGTYLVFPSQTTRENPELPDPEQKAVIFRFEGPIQNIYATLAVRLSHSGLFELKDLWHNAVTYKTEMGGTCGLALHNLGEGRAELTLFFDIVEDSEEGKAIRLHFEDYVYEHLRRRALAESVQREHIFTCLNCGVQFTQAQVLRRRQRGFNTLICSVCETPVSIVDRDQEFSTKSLVIVSAMNRSANAQREHEMVASLRSSSRTLNPYYEMSGVHNPEMFVGREELLQRLFSAIVPRQSISVLGSRRVGKSALIQHMHRPEVQQEFASDIELSQHLFVLIDLGEFIYKTNEDFFRKVSKHIIAQLDEKLGPQSERPELLDHNRGDDLFETVLEQAMDQGFHTVLLLDGFDNILRNKLFDPDFLKVLRAFAVAGKVSYVTTSVKPLSEICHKALLDSPFFNIFGTYLLGTLTREEAEQLVREPSRLAGCPFTNAEIAWVLSLAGRHPFFIQRVCNFLFEEKVAGGGMTDLNKVKGQVYDDFLPHFNHIWESLNTTEQDQFLNEGVSAADEQQRQFPELSESDLFRDFVLEKTGKYFFRLNANELEKALQHIDNPVALGTSNLRYLKSVARRLDSSSALTVEVGRVIREVLKEAWGRLHGEGTRTDIASDWLSYNILYYRYFHRYHWSNQQIALRIGFSTRQYYRERSKAIGELLNVLLEMEA